MADPCVSVLPGVSLPETAGLKVGYRLRRAPSLFGLPYEYPLSIQNFGACPNLSSAPVQALLSLPRCPPEHRHACSGAGPPAGNSNYRARSTIAYPLKYSIGPARTTSHVLWRRPYRFLRRPPEQRRTCSGAGPPIGNSFIIWPILAQP